MTLDAEQMEIAVEISTLLARVRYALTHVLLCITVLNPADCFRVYASHLLNTDSKLQLLKLVHVSNICYIYILILVPGTEPTTSITTMETTSSTTIQTTYPTTFPCDPSKT